MPPIQPLQNYVSLSNAQSKGRPVLPLILVIIGIIIFGGAYLAMKKPQAVPTNQLFDKFFPSGSAIQAITTIDLNVDSVISNPLFQKLQEHGPVPLQLPPLGKQDPFN